MPDVISRNWLNSFFWNSAWCCGPMWRCVYDRVGFFVKQYFPPKMGKTGQKWAKHQVCWKMFIMFSWIRNFLLFAVFLHKFYIWEKFDVWDMHQNALGQSNFRIFKSTIFLEQNDGKVSFFVWWHRFIQIKSWLKNTGVGVIKNGEATLAAEL